MQYVILINDKVQENTIRCSKQLCINDFIEKNPNYPNWEYAYSLGLRCIKVNININVPT